MVNAPEDEQFQMTDDEAFRIKEALKNKEFMELLIDYAKEISDPENKKKYEEEIIAMEKQRGQDVRLLKPQSGFVIKTVRLSDDMKVFINMCTSPEVGEHEMQHVKGGAHLSLPHTVSPVREDIDKSGNTCIVYDVCFNGKSYDMGMTDTNFRQTMIDSAFDTIEKRMSIKLDRKNKKFPKMKYKGQARPLILRSEKNENNKTMEHQTCDQLDFPYADITETNSNGGTNKTESTVPKDEKPEQDQPVIPKYKIVHRGYFEMTEYTGNTSLSSTTPKEIIIDIELPMAESANGLDLDIFTQQLVLHSQVPSYHLDIKLPYKVDEDRGKAKFDKSKKILTVTLPILKPAVAFIAPQLPPTPLQQSLVQECSQVEDDQTHVTNGVEAKDVVCTENVPSSVNSTESEELSVVDNFDSISIDLNDVKFDTKNLESMPMNSRLPPYSFDQTEDSMIVVVKIVGVQVAHVSLGITVQQVCLSVPQNPEISDSADWAMVIRLDDPNYFDKDECGFEVYDDRMELKLVKSKCELWERFFVGVTETTLEMELFLTDSTATEIVEKLKALNVHKLPRATVENEAERKAMSMEKQLTQLLDEQDKQTKLNEMKYVTCESNPRFRVGSYSEGSDVDPTQIDLMDLVDDVIDENSPLVSPSSSSASSEAFTRTANRPFGRSYSYDNFNPRLRSILKRSKSDGAANTTDTDDDTTFQRSRAVTYSDGNIRHSESESGLSRRRNKSVSFRDEPIVFEFLKMSKWDWKKQELKKKKQERDRKAKQKQKEKEATNSEQTASSADEDKSKEKATETSETKEEKTAEPAAVVQQKQGGKQARKWKKTDKTRNRSNNSESRSEEEVESKGQQQQQQQQSQKKNKRKKKNKKTANMNFMTTNSGSDSGCVEGKMKPSLNNPLIFQLD